MLTTKQAIAIGRRGGNARARNLSPEVRSEVASWAELIRSQRRRGEVTYTEQRRRLIHLLHSEDPGLAAVLKSLSRLPGWRAYQIYVGLPPEQLAIIESKLDQVFNEAAHG